MDGCRNDSDTICFACHRADLNQTGFNSLYWRFLSFIIHHFKMKNQLIKILIAASLAIPYQLHAQLSPRLFEAIETNSPSSFHRIRVEFKDNVDCYALNHQFKQQRISVSERPKIVITQLQSQAEASQEEILNLLSKEFSNEVRNVQPFWIVNVIVLEAKSEAITAISQFPHVSLIDLENSRILPHDPIIREDAETSRSPNGIEPGLEAINAPAMWALGYTGRGRLVYDYDTGVWPTHPAFSDRFLAHRYPMGQCWYGFFSDTPNGNISDHGTHTLGTMAGLVEETNDTIGVAFGSYWIANDFVTSTVEELPPLTDMMGAFQWALNPDGDVNTTEDIPDVINNSWRWRDDPDTVQCAGMVVNLMNAIEAAGIANVFSGGNSGPGNTTVNAPQRINTSEVNTFSVGSVNGNVAFPYPISNFSTRGPSQCPHNGSLSLEIHPEVVAPGQSVRSAWGTDEFNSISGTSMAAPHVSGAVLLLKEAFPYLSGEDLLWALYLTAVGLGDAGEDNIYGMGIIDVYAAYQYLAQNNTPVNPNEVAWDLGIELNPFANDNGLSCSGAFSPTVTISNLGDSTIQSVHFEYAINGGAAATYNWNGMLLAGQSESVSLPNVSTTDFGELNLSIVAVISGQASEYDLYNNRWHYTTNRREPTSLPFVEDFDHGFGLHDWFIQNPDGGLGWDTTATAGLPWNEYSASVPCYSYNPRNNQRDGLVSPLLQIPSTNEPVWAIFDVAYQKRTSNGIGHDTLLVQVSTDCGQTFTNEVYRKQADELSTNDTTQLNFVPEFEWDWRRDSISLNAFSNEDILLRFETINRKGNNIYIDNLKVVVGDWEPNGLENPEQFVSIYPNPTDHYIRIETRAEATISHLRVLNLLGATQMEQKESPKWKTQLDVSELPKGSYLLEIKVGDHWVTKRFVRI